MLERAVEIVDHGQPFRGDPEALGLALPGDLADESFAKVVQVGHRPQQTIVVDDLCRGLGRCLGGGRRGGNAFGLVGIVGVGSGG